MDAGRTPPSDAGPPVACTDQCRYVRADAPGGGGGTSWADAWSELPAALDRGNAYFVGAGSYPTYTFDDPVGAGGATITIVKATASSHGTDTGWMASYADAPAVFDGLVFAGDDYVVDGATGGGPGSWETGFGIRVTGGGHNIEVDGPSANIVLRHLDVENLGRMHSNNGNDISFYAIGGARNVTIDACYLHDVNGVQLLTRDADGIVLQRSKLARNGPVSDMCVDGPCHREAWSASTDDRITIRWCVFEDISNTAFIFIGNGTGPAESWEIYGNVFWYSGALSDVGVAGLIDVDTPRGIELTGWKFYDNVIANVSGLHAGIKAPGTSAADLLVYDNIWFGNTANAIGADGTVDYNWFYGNTRTEGCPTPCDLDTPAASGEPHGELGTGDPFVDWMAGDFHLRAPTMSGMALGAPYDVDADGVVRGAGGTWDRGAYEHD